MAINSSVKPAETGTNPFLRFVAAISSVSGWIAGGMIVFSVLITCQMIFVRFILNQSTVWQTEAVVYLMVGATLVGLPFVQRLRGHVNVDLLPMLLPTAVRRGLAVLVLILTIAIITIMLFYGTEYWYEAWSRNWKSDTVWGVRLWIPYLALPVGFGLLLLQLVADLIGVLTNIDKPFGIEEEAD